MMNVIDSFERIFKASTKKKYSRNDVLNVWKNISLQVVESLCKGNAVYLKDLGTFTLSEWKIHNGSKSCLQKIQPLFILSKKLSEFYNIKVVNFFNENKIPMKKLNFSGIAFTSGLARETVVDIITHIIQAFTWLIGNNIDTVFPLVGIGSIEVKNKILTAVFDSDFVERVRSSNACSHDVEVCSKKFYTFPYHSGNFWKV